MKNLLKSRRLKYGSLSAAFIAAFIAILVVINIIANLLVNRFPLKIDLTKNKAYSVSNETIEFLKTYDKDTEIIICNERVNLSGNANGASAVELIEGYSKRNSKIKVDYVNIEKNPAFASRYSNDNISNDSVIVRSGDKYRVLSLSNLYNVETDYYGYSTGNVSSDAENEITGALAYIASTKQVKMAFINNHNEADASALKTLLSKNNYIFSDDITLINTDIPSDVEILGIIAPKIDFTDDEIDKLNKFLSNNEKLGRNLLVFMDPSQPSLPKLEGFLKDYWGVKANPGFIYDTKEFVGYQNQLIGTYAEDKISASVQNKRLYTIVPSARPIEITFKDNASGNRTVTPLLTSSENSYYYPDTEGQPNPDNDKKGPFNLMTMSTKTIYEETTPLKSNVLVCGSLNFLYDGIISSPQFGNGDLLVNIANNLSDIESVITIVPKDLSEPIVNFDSSLMPLYLLIFIILIPLAVVIVGVVVFVRRRHL